MSASPYLGCQLAQEFERKRITYPVAVEDKLDGFRVTHVAGNGYTRNGKTYESFRPFSEILRAATDRHGSVHVDTEMKAPNWNETSKLLKRVKDVNHDRIRQLVTCYVFDVFDQQSIGVDPYVERRRAVEWVVAKAQGIASGHYSFEAAHAVIVHDDEELRAAFEGALKRGHEGVMIKPLDGVYTLKRSFAWLKLKPFMDITVTITGAEHGWGLCPTCMAAYKREERAAVQNAEWTIAHGGRCDEECDHSVSADGIKPDPECPTCAGAAAGIERPDLLGSLHCVDERGRAVRVGMGFTAEQKVDFWERRAELVGKKIDVKVQVESGGNEIVARHPTFLRFREDV